MCGRTACSLAPDDICHACGHVTANGQWTQPAWKPAMGDKQYKPSYNIGPTCYLPVLLSKKHLPEEKNKSLIDADMDETESSNPCSWIIQPMRWGLVPSWHTGDLNKVGYNMINARSDKILEKKTFKMALDKGRRCVVLAEGYFEWHHGKDGKQPYFFYQLGEHTENVKTEDGERREETLKDAGGVPKHGKKKQLVRMAALFDVSSQAESKGNSLYSFSVITVAAHEKLRSIHDRMPAVLTSDKELKDWLDFGNVPVKKAVDLLHPVDIDFYPVSTFVNNVRNDTSECVKPIELGKKKETGSSQLMSDWLRKGKQRSDQKRRPDTAENTTDKKMKTT